MNTRLFSPLTQRKLTLRNRIVMSPMCQYSAKDGFPTEWHQAHYVSRAVGGAGLILVEASAVAPEGRITPHDIGLWSSEQAQSWQPILNTIRDQGTAVGIQLAHAGRKAATARPWEGGRPLTAENGAWPIAGASPIPFAEGYQRPEEMSPHTIEQVVAQFKQSAELALEAGFQVAEIHMAHGYLLHSFLSPIANQRQDEWGGTLDNRMRLPLKIAEEIRAIWPEEWPVWVRISATDWVEHGWDLAQSVVLADRLKALGVDLIDCSSGGLTADAKIPAAPGFQTPFAATIRNRVDIATGAVGLITSPEQAEHILQTDQADAILLGREMLRNPYWPLQAASQLGQTIEWPPTYQRAARR